MKEDITLLIILLSLWYLGPVVVIFHISFRIKSDAGEAVCFVSEDRCIFQSREHYLTSFTEQLLMVTFCSSGVNVPATNTNMLERNH